MFDREVKAMALEQVSSECREVCEREARLRGTSAEQVLVERGVRHMASALQAPPALRVIEGGR